MVVKIYATNQVRESQHLELIGEFHVVGNQLSAYR
jgi:hypothetical protein